MSSSTSFSIPGKKTHHDLKQRSTPRNTFTTREKKFYGESQTQKSFTFPLAKDYTKTNLVRNDGDVLEQPKIRI